jgi:hypothetical protein
LVCTGAGSDISSSGFMHHPHACWTGPRFEPMYLPGRRGGPVVVAVRAHHARLRSATDRQIGIRTAFDAVHRSAAVHESRTVDRSRRDCPIVCVTGGDVIVS